MKFFVGLLCAALCAFVGCSSPPPLNIDTGGSLHLPAIQSYTFWVDPDVSPDGVLAVKEAVKQWTEFTDVQIQINYGFQFCVYEPGCFTVFEVPRSELDALTLDSSYIGYTFLGVIGIAQGMPWDELQDTMIHEFGHALGLEHHPRPALAVMNPDYRGGGDRVECDDVDQFYLVRNLPTPTLPACSSDPGPLDEAADGGPAGD